MAGKNQLTFYWQYYGLNKDPFSAIPDLTMSIPIEKFDNCGQLILKYIREENTIIAITGDEGLGKTTLLNHLAAKLQTEADTLMIEADSLLSPEKLLQRVVYHWQLNLEESENLNEYADSVIQSLQFQSKICLVVLDNAHLAPAATINLLFDMLRQQSQYQHRLHVILSGNAHFRNKLLNVCKASQADHLLRSMDLQPLDFDETKNYLEQRLALAGFNNQTLLQDNDIKMIFQQSRGNPDKINRLAQQYLIDKVETYMEENQQSHSFFQQHQTKILGGALLAAGILILALIMPHHNTNQDNTIQTAEQGQNVNLPDQGTNNNQQAAVIFKAVPDQDENQQNLAQNTQPDQNQQTVNADNFDDHAQYAQADNNAGLAPQSQTDVGVNNTVKNTDTQTSPNNQNPDAVNPDAALLNNATANPQAKLNSNDENPAYNSDSANLNANNTNVTQDPANLNPAAQGQNDATVSGDHNFTQEENNPANQTLAANNIKTDMQNGNTANPAYQNENQAAAANGPAYQNEDQTNSASKSIDNTNKNTGNTNPVNAAASSNVNSQYFKEQQDIINNTQAEKSLKKAAHHVSNLNTIPGIQENARHLLKANKRHYTLQLLGLSNEKELKAFISKNNLGANAHYFKTELNQKPWYILVYGEYPSVQSAEHAKNNLPEKLKQYQPWVRKMQYVQAEIRK